MSFTNDKKQHYKTIRQTCYTANIAYLILRVLYLVLFIVAKLYILVWVDLASIAFYLACFFLMKKEKYYIYALLCGNEFFAFIIATTLMVGFSTGFHFYLIGLSVVSFFTSYFSKYKNIKASILWAMISLGIYFTLYFVTKHNQPHYVIDEWLETTLFVVHVITVFLFVVFYLVVFLKYTLSLEKKIMIESRTDVLTQLSNRYGLYDHFHQLNDKSTRVLALLDIDDFKLINDQYGHNTGDFILKRVAEIATEELRDSFVCRYGGEEFVIMMNNENYFNRLEAFRLRIENENFEFEGNSYHITITIGASEYNQEMALEKWVDLADAKMYLGKNSGKNKTIR